MGRERPAEPDNERQAAPVFVVGAPRSGTSILTWCLGQHPNILPLEESTWIGSCALDVGAAHARGSARGERSPLGALGVTRDEHYAAFGACIDALILGHRAALERHARRVGERDPAQVHAGLAAVRADSEPKSRWVDGAPEHSFYICGLLRLFPRARFVHIVREVDDVVASMLRFRHDDGSCLVPDREAAYDYWLRAVRACAAAEQALGAGLVLRVRYADLTAAPEATLRRILDFLGEPFEPACVGALAVRVSQSDHPAPFGGADGPLDAATRERVQQVNATMQREAQPPGPSSLARGEFEAAFDQRVQFIEDLDARYTRAQQALGRCERQLHERTAWAQRLDAEPAQLRQRLAATKRQLQDEHKVVGRSLAMGAIAAGGMCAAHLFGADPSSRLQFFLWLALALGATGCYAWLRRRGWQAAFSALAGRVARPGKTRPVS